MTSAELIVELKAQGFGTSLTETQWGQVVTDALAMFSRQRPQYVLDTFTTTADLATYDLPAGGYLCLAVSPQQTIDDLWAELTGTSTDSPLIGDGDAIVDFHRPSLTDAFRQKLEAWARQFGSDFEQPEPGGPVRLIPAPSEAQEMAWYYTALHTTVDTVPDGALDLLKMAGRACAMGALALGKTISVLDSGGRLTLGPYTKDTGSSASLVAKLFGEAQKLEEAFYRAAYLPAGAIRG